MENVLAKISEEKLVAIIRADNADDIEKVIDSLYAGGFKLVEVTLNTGGAIDAIKKLKNRYADLLVGAGTVLDKEDAQQAIDAGAKFLLAPTLDKETIQTGNDEGVPVIPGVMTPTEALQAYRWGAKMVKVFPAKSVGIDFAKDLKGPLPFIKVMAVGGVNPNNVSDYLNQKWDTVGIGSSLVNQERIEDKNFDEIEQIARQFTEAKRK